MTRSVNHVLVARNERRVVGAYRNILMQPLRDDQPKVTILCYYLLGTRGVVNEEDPLLRRWDNMVFQTR